jgi:hypothetical protein
MRAFVRLLLAVLVVGTALQCQDRQNPTEVDPSGLEAANAESDAIVALLGEIFNGGLEGAAVKQAKNIFRQLDRGLEADAQAKAIALVDFILEKQADGQTVGDDEDVVTAMSLILEYVGFTVELPDADADAGIAVCGPEGCEVVTESEHAGLDVPEGAFDQQVVVVVELLPDQVSGPLDTGFNQYPQFYNIYTIPADAELNLPADIGLCVLEQDDGWEQGAPNDVLADLVLAHPAPGGPGTGNCDADIECLPVVIVADLIDCSDLEFAYGGFRGLLDDFTRTLVSPLSPSLLYASPGDLGGQASSFSPFAAVDPTTAFDDGFEDGLAWTPTGFWNRTMGGITNAAVPTYVSLAPDDGSVGALPAASEGSWYIWYGNSADGNYIGTQAAGDGSGSGGTSEAANAGSITSPAFNLPASVTNPTLTFDAWFEIESVNSSAFDLMTVSVIDGETVTVLGTLNPPSDPLGPAATPFTSSGFDLAPSFGGHSFSLAAFSGSEIQIVFSFATGDVLYNGFRGWIIDDVRVAEGPPPILSGLTPAASRTSSLDANRAACGGPVCPDFPQRRDR